MILRPLPEHLAPTLQTLHTHARAVGAVARSYGISHPKWWHIALEVLPFGMATRPIPVVDGGAIGITIDPRNSEIVVESSWGQRAALDLHAASNGTEASRALVQIVSGLGLEDAADRAGFVDDDPLRYDPQAARDFFEVLVDVQRLLELHRSTLDHRVGPIQLWPHGFDLAFEWFGDLVVTHQEAGETVTSPSQLNFGFYPADRAYFYSNPFPFHADHLTRHPLPSGAEWHTDGWNGSILYYDLVAERVDGSDLVLEYARAVHEVARPTLMA